MPAKTDQVNGATFDAELVARAKSGNITAKGQLFKVMHGDKRGGEDETAARLDKLLATNSDNSNADDKPNPFKAKWWSLKRQGEVYKADPALCERLAKSAGVKVGALRPVM